jgi:hypothetical protein
MLQKEQEMGTMKPIETVHNGYRFRSGLEARWGLARGEG